MPASCYTKHDMICSLVVTCWARADLLALLYVMLSCAIVTSPYGGLSQVGHLIVWTLDLRFFLTFTLCIRMQSFIKIYCSVQEL